MTDGIELNRSQSEITEVPSSESENEQVAIKVESPPKGFDVFDLDGKTSVRQQRLCLSDRIFSWCYSLVVIEIENLLASVGDPEVTQFSDIIGCRPCVLNVIKSLRHLPFFSYNNMSEDKIPKQAGIDELIDLGKNALNCDGVHAYRNEKGRSHLNIIAAIKVNKRYVLLLTATLSATALFIAAFNIPHFIPRASHINDYDSDQTLQYIRDSTLTLPFILLNSAGFILSLTIIISILRDFPMKPWPQITVSMFLLSYVSLIMKILPWASMLVLGFSILLLVLAAVGKVFKFD